MIHHRRLALLSVIVASSVFAGCPGAEFSPSGNWTLSFDRVEAYSTYTSAEEMRTVTPFSELMLSPPPFPTVVVSYNASTPDSIVIAGNPYALDADRTAIISNTVMSGGGPGCVINEISRAVFSFLGEEGRTAEYRLVEETQFTGCTALLEAAQMNIMATGMIPSDVENAVFFGGVRIATLHQLTSFGFASVIAGTHSALSPGANASAVEVFEFSSGVSAAWLKRHTWTLIEQAAAGNVQPLLDAVRAAQEPNGI